MNKLLIVDDEYIIRKGLIHSIDWAEYGFGSVKEADDGRAAWELIETFQPDVVITDIRMPLMDGIELLGKIKGKYPHISVILLSGFEDFKYVQAGISLGADDYVLKLMYDTDLLKALEKVVAKIHAQKQEEQKVTQIIREKDSALICNFVLKAIDGSLTEQDIEEMPTLQIDYQSGSFCITYLCVDFNPKKNAEEDYHSVADYKTILELADMTDGIDDHSFLVRRGNDAIILHWGSPGLHEQVRTMWEKIVRKIERQPISDLIVRIGLGMEVFSYRSIATSYINAKRCVFSSSSSAWLLLTSAYDIHSENEAVLQHEEEVELSKMLVNSNLDDILISLGRILNKREDMVNAERVKSILLQYVLLVSFKLREMGLPNSSMNISVLDIYEKIQVQKSKKAMIGQLAAWIDTIAKQIRQSKQSSSKKTVMDAIEYIKAHFNEKISLESVANYVFLSAPYFSSVFKKETGKAFIDYLTDLRIEKAKMFLLQGESVTEAAMHSGYRDMKHFGKMFKKYNNGLNPSNFKNN